MSSDQEEASHVIVVYEGIHRVEESPFLEVERSTLGSLQLMKKGSSCRSRNQANCGTQCRSEPRTGRQGPEGHKADSGF